MDAMIGVETEYALVSLDKQGRRRDPQAAAVRLMELAMERLPCLRSTDGQGVFLANGGKLYIDVGCHPEYGTPECADPWTLVAHVRAGDRLLSRLASWLAADGADAQALMFRGNVGYGPHPQTWACHESYLTRRPPGDFTEQIVPFLVSRVLFCGSGGFQPHGSGIAFTLSPRAAFLTTLASGETMRARPIMNLRDESLSGPGYHRLHIICADSVGSEAAMWLRAGTTALAAALIDAGERPAETVALRDPVAAMKTFAADMTLKATVETRRGAQVSALDIQRVYLEQVERRLAGGGLPWWAAKVAYAWRQMLAILETDPAALETVLDWAIKRAVYAEFCWSRGVEWDTLPHWTTVVHQVYEAYRKAGIEPPPPLTPRAILARRGPIAEAVKPLTALLHEKRLDWEALPRFLALRGPLFEIDTRFLQLGGIFQSLEDAGTLNHSVLYGEQRIAEAETAPPTVGRAAIRGRSVQQFSGSANHACGWNVVADYAAHRRIDLADPFTASAAWQPMQGAPPAVRAY